MTIDYSSTTAFTNQDVKAQTYNFLGVENRFAELNTEATQTLAKVSCLKIHFQHHLNVEQAEGLAVDPTRAQVLSDPVCQQIGLSQTKELEDQEESTTMQAKIQGLKHEIRVLFSNISVYKTNGDNTEVLEQTAKDGKEITNKEVLTALQTKLIRMFAKLNSFEKLFDRRKDNIQAIETEHKKPAMISKLGFRDHFTPLAKLTQTEADADAILKDVDLAFKSEENYLSTELASRFGEVKETLPEIEGFKVDDPTSMKEVAQKITALVEALKTAKEQNETFSSELQETKEQNVTLSRELEAAKQSTSTLRGPLQTIAGVEDSATIEELMNALNITDSEVKKKE